jgi:DNA-methyltransferase (dcm)
MEKKSPGALDLSALKPFGFYEFFAGGGMARLGLGAAWTCLFSNDFDEKKVASYRANFSPATEMHHGDVALVQPTQLPGQATLAWASFPCQDLSLAGNGKGLAGNRSGVFWAFWKLMKQLRIEGRRPPIIALENVSGLITSHRGEDLTNLVGAFSSEGYRVGAIALDGALFVAQSRPRVFLIAVARGVTMPKGLVAKVPNPVWHPESLQNVVEGLSPQVRKDWLWWKLPVPRNEAPHLLEVIEREPQGVKWHTAAETKKLLSMMTPGNLLKVAEAKKAGTLQVGTIYRRTRHGVQRAEVRFDGVSGCLRTPSGGSSRQLVMLVEGETVRTRLISPRETARLMGLPETYILPERYNDTYHLTGDGLVVPAVSWIEQNIIRPVGLSAQKLLDKSSATLPLELLNG